MPSLYERLTGSHATRSRIPVHQFQSALALWARGEATGSQANAIVAAMSGTGLDTLEAQEAQDLVSTVPTGTTTANQAARALRLIFIDQALLLAEFTVRLQLPPLSSTQALRDHLGVPTR